MGAGYRVGPHPLLLTLLASGVFAGDISPANTPNASNVEERDGWDVRRRMAGAVMAGRRDYRGAMGTNLGEDAR
ncbi:MAG TPA: hypothetical protein DEH05_08340 [Propionibacteriaceae bacterium]|nr:hypothetical protein [Propionibacteriaceae bacterium]